ncbi:hypothetical protein DZF79_15650 [Vibrio parahaemolyticus]|nr:hypothetical protein [Vibrio parahaemolyticus]
MKQPTTEDIAIIRDVCEKVFQHFDENFSLNPFIGDGLGYMGELVIRDNNKKVILGLTCEIEIDIRRRCVGKVTVQPMAQFVEFNDYRPRTINLKDVKGGIETVIKHFNAIQQISRNKHNKPTYRSPVSLLERAEKEAEAIRESLADKHIKVVVAAFSELNSALFEFHMSSGLVLTANYVNDYFEVELMGVGVSLRRYQLIRVLDAI